MIEPPSPEIIVGGEVDGSSSKLQVSERDILSAFLKHDDDKSSLVVSDLPSNILIDSVVA